MSAKEDLQKKIQSLKDQTSEAQESLNKILCAECAFQPGDIVLRNGCEKYTVSSVRMTYGRAVPWGRKTLKSGVFGIQEFELYGDIKKATHEDI